MEIKRRGGVVMMKIRNVGRIGLDEKIEEMNEIMDMKEMKKNDFENDFIMMKNPKMKWWLWISILSLSSLVLVSSENLESQSLFTSSTESSIDILSEEMEEEMNRLHRRRYSPSKTVPSRRRLQESAGSPAPNFRTIEYYALRAMYESLAGDYWIYQSDGTFHGNPWDFEKENANPCIDHWRGLTCKFTFDEPVPTFSPTMTPTHEPTTAGSPSDDDLGYADDDLGGAMYFVVSINMTDYNMTGILPPEIGDFVDLTSFGLRYNALHDQIPLELYNLTSLVSLDLSLNYLNETFSPRFATMPSLRHLDLSSNYFHGALPREEQLYKTISGDFSDDELLENTTSNRRLQDLVFDLETLNLANNNFEGPIPNYFGRFPFLQMLALSMNYFVGTVPSELGEIKNLVRLDLAGNLLSGTIPQSILDLQNLRRLNLQNNLFTGPPPVSFHIDSPLEELNLAVNSYTGTIPLELGALSSLVKLTLNNNMFNTTLDDLTDSAKMYAESFVSFFPKLERIYLNSNELHGTIPDSICYFNPKILTHLFLGTNDIHGKLPSCLFTDFTELQYLSLGNNYFTGSIPDVFGKPPSQDDRRLDSFSSLNDSYIDSMMEIEMENDRGKVISRQLQLGNTKLHLLDLRSNLLTGTLPQSLSVAKQLTYLYLQENLFMEQIPSSYGELSALTIMFLYDNIFTGNLPESFVNLTLLRQLYAYDNFLTGGIPNFLLDCPSLRYLYLHRNIFYGPLPPNMGTAHVLRQISIHNNFITGTVPLSLGGLPDLEVLYLHHNFLTGSLPDLFGSSLKDMTVLLMHENFLSGTIPPSIATMQYLRQLNVSQNFFSGILPVEFAQMTKFISLDLSGNRFSGPVLQLMSNFSSLKVLFLHSNQFSGPMDGLVRNMSHVECEYIVNLWTDDLQDDGSFQSITLDDERIPVDGDWQRRLRRIQLSPPQTTRLPLSLSTTRWRRYSSSPNEMVSDSRRKLVEEELSSVNDRSTDNIHPLAYLSFPPPTPYQSFSDTISLEELESDGAYTTTVGAPIDPGEMSNLCHTIVLKNVDLSDNAFSGTLSKEFFVENDGLMSFAAMKNCFWGSLPDELCTSPVLQSLALDGLSAAEPCRHALWSPSRHAKYRYDDVYGDNPKVVNVAEERATQLAETFGFEVGDDASWSRRLTASLGPLQDVIDVVTGPVRSATKYQLSYFIEGGVPNCLYGMPALVLLHLSGNGLITKIPDVYYKEYHVSHAPTMYPTRAPFKQDDDEDDFKINKLNVKDKKQSWNTFFRKLVLATDEEDEEPEEHHSHVALSESLRYLNLAFNRVYGELPESMQLRPSGWLELDLAFNRIGGTLSEHFQPYLTNTTEDNQQRKLSEVWKSIEEEFGKHRNLRSYDSSTLAKSLMSSSEDTATSGTESNVDEESLDTRFFSLVKKLSPSPSAFNLPSEEYSTSLSDSPTNWSTLRLLLYDLLSQGMIREAILIALISRGLINYDDSGGQIFSQIVANVSTSHVKLDSNFFSGSIPAGLVPMENIAILEGNLFGCNVLRSFASSVTGETTIGDASSSESWEIEPDSLPWHDPLTDTYSCGSESTNFALFAWFAVLLVIVMPLAIFHESLIGRLISGKSNNGNDGKNWWRRTQSKWQWFYNECAAWWSELDFSKSGRTESTEENSTRPSLFGDHRQSFSAYSEQISGVLSDAISSEMLGDTKSNYNSTSSISSAAFAASRASMGVHADSQKRIQRRKIANGCLCPTPHCLGPFPCPTLAVEKSFFDIEMMTAWIVRLAITTVLILLPVYVLLNAVAGSYTVPYVWSLSYTVGSGAMYTSLLAATLIIVIGGVVVVRWLPLCLRREEGVAGARGVSGEVSPAVLEAQLRSPVAALADTASASVIAETTVEPDPAMRYSGTANVEEIISSLRTLSTADQSILVASGALGNIVIDQPNTPGTGNLDNTAEKSPEKSVKDLDQWKRSLVWYLKAAILLIVNIVIVGVSHVMYVAVAADGDYSRVAALSSTLGLAIFKIAWNELLTASPTLDFLDDGKDRRREASTAAAMAAAEKRRTSLIGTSAPFLSSEVPVTSQNTDSFQSRSSSSSSIFSPFMSASRDSAATNREASILYEPSLLFKHLLDSFSITLSPWPSTSPTRRAFLPTLHLLNTVIIPAIVVVAVHSQCLAYLITTSPPDVSSIYSFTQCSSIRSTTFTTTCAIFSQSVHVLTYSPPFFYSSQCSFVLLQSMAQVVLYKALVQSILPLIFICLKALQSKLAQWEIRDEVAGEDLEDSLRKAQLAARLEEEDDDLRRRAMSSSALELDLAKQEDLETRVAKHITVQTWQKLVSNRYTCFRVILRSLRRKLFWIINWILPFPLRFSLTPELLQIIRTSHGISPDVASYYFHKENNLLDVDEEVENSPETLNPIHDDSNRNTESDKENPSTTVQDCNGHSLQAALTTQACFSSPCLYAQAFPEWVDILRNRPRELLCRERLSLALYSNAVVALTFGIAFPPLAATAAIALVVAVIRTRLQTGRLLGLLRAAGENRFDPYASPDVIFSLRKDASENDVNDGRFTSVSEYVSLRSSFSLKKPNPSSSTDGEKNVPMKTFTQEQSTKPVGEHPELKDGDLSLFLDMHIAAIRYVGHELAPLIPTLRAALPAVALISAFLQALCLFDTASSEYGVATTWWILPTFTFVPVMIYMLFSFFARHYNLIEDHWNKDPANEKTRSDSIASSMDDSDRESESSWVGESSNSNRHSSVDGFNVQRHDSFARRLSVLGRQSLNFFSTFAEKHTMETSSNDIELKSIDV